MVGRVTGGDVHRVGAVTGNVGAVVVQAPIEDSVGKDYEFSAAVKGLGVSNLPPLEHSAVAVSDGDVKVGRPRVQALAEVIVLEVRPRRAGLSGYGWYPHQDRR